MTAEYEPTAEQAWLMTKLLEQAVEAARALPPEMQEAYVTAAAGLLTELFHLNGCRLYRTGHPLAFCLFWLKYLPGTNQEQSVAFLGHLQRFI